jgi:predicted GIY-YIG superfamily endonuclease
VKEREIKQWGRRKKEVLAESSGVWVSLGSVLESKHRRSG